MRGRLFILLLSCMLSAFTVAAQEELPEEMVNAFKKGEAEQLKPYLCDKVQFIVEGDMREPLAQKEAIDFLKNFFAQNRPTGFSVLHKSFRDDTGFFIAKLTTSSQKYRMHCLFNLTSGTLRISQIRIDKFIE